MLFLFFRFSGIIILPRRTEKAEDFSAAAERELIKQIKNNR